MHRGKGTTRLLSRLTGCARGPTAVRHQRLRGPYLDWTPRRLPTPGRWHGSERRTAGLRGSRGASSPRPSPAAGATGRAFHNDPIRSAMFPNDTRPAFVLPRVFTAFIRGAAASGGHITTTPDYSAVAVWSPPGTEIKAMANVRNYGLDLPRIVVRIPLSSMPATISFFGTLAATPPGPRPGTALVPGCSGCRPFSPRPGVGHGARPGGSGPGRLRACPASRRHRDRKQRPLLSGIRLPCCRRDHDKASPTPNVADGSPAAIPPRKIERENEKRKKEENSLQEANHGSASADPAARMWPTRDTMCSPAWGMPPARGVPG